MSEAPKLIWVCDSGIWFSDDQGEPQEYEPYHHASTLSALQDQNRALREVIRLVDLYAPRADETCDEPGITFSEAICRQFGVDINILAATKQEGE